MLMNAVYMIMALFATYLVVKGIIELHDFNKEGAALTIKLKELEKELLINIEIMGTLMDDIIKEHEKIK